MHERERRIRPIMSFSELSRKYPSAAEWLYDGDHPTAQVIGDTRILSAYEKLELLDKLPETQERLIEFSKTNINPVILQACEIDPMTPWEIDLFFQGLITSGDPENSPAVPMVGKLHHALTNLSRQQDGQEKAIEVVRDIIYIARITNNLNRFLVTTENKGYLTTATGGRLLQRHLHSTRRNY